MDFGNVFHKSGSRVTVVMENHSLLPQQFSFVRLPKEISIVTDNGTGHILPQE
jgi:pyruvate/2-oxoglutarate dehydrogenase complex dihydrolipoamide dehydrogenase (E3) component